MVENMRHPQVESGVPVASPQAQSPPHNDLEADFDDKFADFHIHDMLLPHSTPPHSLASNRRHGRTRTYHPHLTGM